MACLGQATTLLLFSGCTLFPERDRTSFRTPVRRMEAMQTLAEEAASKTPEQKREVAQTISRQYQGEGDPLLRRQMIRTLAQYPQAESLAILRLAAAQDADVNVRVEAIREIARLRPPDAVEQLASALQRDTEIDVRLAGARALGGFPVSKKNSARDRRVLEALALALEDSDPALQYRVLESLRSASGEDFGTDLSAWRTYAQTGAPPNRPSASLAEQFRGWLRF